MSEMSFTVMLKLGNSFPTGFLNLFMSEINRLRTNPRSYIEYIQSSRYDDYPASERRNAIEYLQSISQGAPLPAFTLNPLLSEMAQTWVNTQGRTGATGHGNLQQRLSQANIPLNTGTYAFAENIAYGFTEPRDILIAWIVDYLVPDKGHRVNLFRRDLNQIGIGFGLHTNSDPDQNLRVMVVNEYGSGFRSQR